MNKIRLFRRDVTLFAMLHLMPGYIATITGSVMCFRDTSNMLVDILDAPIVSGHIDIVHVVPAYGFVVLAILSCHG